MFLIVRIANRVDDALEEQFEDPAEAKDPAQKKCPFCRSRIPFRAVRCPHCTSELEKTGAAQVDAPPVA